MAGRVVTVADTSIFIGLARVDELELLDILFERVHVVPAVLAELAPRPSELAHIVSLRCIHPDVAQSTLHPATAELQPGEQQVISRALADELDLVLLDEKRARTCAENLGLIPFGVLGILARARRASLIPQLREPLRTLIAAGFRLPRDAINAQLKSLGEPPISPDD